MVSEVVVDAATTKSRAVTNYIAEEHNYCPRPDPSKVGM